jgi:hypothetical protein
MDVKVGERQPMKINETKQACEILSVARLVRVAVNAFRFVLKIVLTHE